MCYLFCLGLVCNFGVGTWCLFGFNLVCHVYLLVRLDSGGGYCCVVLC